MIVRNVPSLHMWPELDAVSQCTCVRFETNLKAFQKILFEPDKVTSS